MSNRRIALEQEVDSVYPLVIDRDRGAFGQWISGLWTWHPHLTFNDQKEAFFALLERLLKDEKVMLFPPWRTAETAPVRFMKGYEGGANLPEGIKKRVPPEEMDGEIYPFGVWDIPIEEQMAYIRSVFPKDATRVYDGKINEFFYNPYVCPTIGWVVPGTDKIIAS